MASGKDDRVLRIALDVLDTIHREGLSYQDAITVACLVKAALDKAALRQAAVELGALRELGFSS